MFGVPRTVVFIVSVLCLSILGMVVFVSVKVFDCVLLYLIVSFVRVGVSRALGSGTLGSIDTLIY